MSERLEIAAEYDGLHDFVPFRFQGKLPSDRAKMLEKLDTAIAAQKKKPPVVALV